MGRARGEQDPTSLCGKAVALVTKLGQATTDTVVAYLGKEVSAAWAMRRAVKKLKAHRTYAQKKVRRNEEAGRRQGGGGVPRKKHTKPQLIALGRRAVLNNTMQSCVRRGFLRRLKPGLYAPPLPKLYEPVALEPQAS